MDPRGKGAGIPTPTGKKKKKKKSSGPKEAKNGAELPCKSISSVWGLRGTKIITCEN